MTAVLAEAPGVVVPTLLGSTPPAEHGGPLRWSRFLPATRAEGPGLRAALWVQGCSVHCPGCFNPQMWATRGGVVSGPADVVTDWIDRARAAGATGVTLLGGEPFDQAEAVATVARAFRDAGMDVMAFTGYRLEDLDVWGAERRGIRDLLAVVDLLCDGPYLRAHPDVRRPWIGSTNQSIRALSPVHRDLVERIATDGGSDSLEVRIGADGTIQVNGWAPDAALSALFDDLGVRADRPRDLARPSLPECAA